MGYCRGLLGREGVREGERERERKRGVSTPNPGSLLGPLYPVDGLPEDTGWLG